MFAGSDRYDLALSVVVMGYRDRESIIDAVRSVVEQMTPDPFEVIVVVSGGDDSADAVRRLFPAVPVVESPARLLPGAARNVGVAASRGRVVAFLAGDCVAEPDWIAARLAAHRRGYPIVAGAMTNGGDDRPWKWASYFDLFSGRLTGRPAGVVDAPDPAAHGLSYDRSALERIGAFDEQLRTGEDTGAASRAHEVGLEIWFEPNVRTAHRGPSGTLDLIRDQYRRGARRARVDTVGMRPTKFWRALVAFLPVWFIWLRLRVTRIWRYAPGERSRLLLCLPWLALARAAGVAGWYRERLRRSRF